MNVKRRHSIKLFTYAQFGIVLIFAVVTLFSLIRLTQLGNLLKTITNDTIPQITRSSVLNTKIHNLATFTTMLSNSDSMPAFQLAKSKLDAEMQLINKPQDTDLRKSTTKNDFLTKQVTIIIQEVNELESLVKERIIGKQAFQNTQAQFNSSTLGMFTQLSSGESESYMESIKNEVLDILLIALQIDQQTRIHKIRQVEERLIAKFANVKINLINKDTNLLNRISQIEVLLLGDNGLIEQKIETLRVTGRTRGRSNFVRNLIEDVAGSLQYESHVTNRTGIQNAKDATELADKYTSITILLGLVSITLTLCIIYFLYKRIVSRLLSLSKQVEIASIDRNKQIYIEGRDEIAMLADEFSTYLAKLANQEAALLNMTLTDPLTNIPNRRAFEEELTSSVAAAKRNKWNLSVLFIDIDYFKLYNDHYGHAEGDNCLQLVAKELNDYVMRDTDFCARVGGEEFVCILPNIDHESAMLKAEQLCKAIEKLKIRHARSDINKYVTVSIGMTGVSFQKGRDYSQHEIILAADKALYEAKAEGRNQVKQSLIS